MGLLPKKLGTRHAWYVCIMIIGWLVPPLAVLMRFGVGRDFFINIFFTIMGYIPGHVHNFYLQNIRQNSGRRRTPKWAIRYGLVKDHNAKMAKKRQWAHSYNERIEENQYDDPTRAEEDEWGNRVRETQSSSTSATAPPRPPAKQRLGLDPAEDDLGDDATPNNYETLSARDLDKNIRDDDSSLSSMSVDARSRNQWLQGGKKKSEKLNSTRRRGSSISTNGSAARDDFYYNNNGANSNGGGLDDLPGAGDRRTKSQRKKNNLRSLVTGSKSRDTHEDRFSRMERERQMAYGGYNSQNRTNNHHDSSTNGHDSPSNGGGGSSRDPLDHQF